MLKADFGERQCGIVEKDYRLNGGRMLLVFCSIAFKRSGVRFPSGPPKHYNPNPLLRLVMRFGFVLFI